jgi:hypothetical protein
MKALRRCAKKLFSFRKIVWLFLCGMLITAAEAGAQQANQGDKQPVGGNGTTITEPVVKYGPPPSLTPPSRPPHMMTKYGPPPSFKPNLDERLTPNPGPGEKTPKAN